MLAVRAATWLAAHKPRGTARSRALPAQVGAGDAVSGGSERIARRLEEPARSKDALHDREVPGVRVAAAGGPVTSRTGSRGIVYAAARRALSAARACSAIAAISCGHAA